MEVVFVESNTVRINTTSNVKVMSFIEDSYRG